MSAKNDERRKWQGGKWITPVRRLALYLRDGLACTYCGATVEDGGTVLSLDHVRCNVKGGGNESSNLVTCCTRCNSSRAHRPLRTFCRAVAAYLNHGVTGEEIERRVRAAVRKAVPVEEAREMLERRGSVVKAVHDRKRDQG